MKIQCKKYFIAVCMLFVTIGAAAQNQHDREFIRTQTNLAELQKIEKRSYDSLQAHFARAASQNIPLQKINEKGSLGVLFSFDENGKPIYAFDDNINAAKTGRTDKIWVGGSTGLNLTGVGVQIGVWESGKALATHVEYSGRVSDGGDGALVTQHATHTAGTLIATGVSANARGMASLATVKNYTASGMQGEAAAFAITGGILANNSNTPTGTTGTYDSNSQGLDNVLYNAPFLFIGKSAGNDGNTYGIIESTQLCKNLLVVGNCSDQINYSGPLSVTMSSSSSFGPSKDWRIKPDITNNGVSLTSASNETNTSYASLSGTSMATPATIGAVALLQQHYNNINGVYMRAATAKALLINAADEVGANPGPDFRSGWGLMNAETAASMITSNGTSSLIEEKALINGETYTRNFTSDGVTPVAVTIAWSDPMSATSASANPIIINDLDVRITRNLTTYFPWVMVPNINFNNYTDAAAKGDNFRDNVERINEVLPAGVYTINVSHKGTLVNSPQAFSLVANGIAPEALPLTWVGLLAQRKQKTVLVEWQTQQENNLLFFTVEKSNDGIKWETSSDKIAGTNTNRLAKYSFTDNQYSNGKLYYRIKYTNAGGQFKYSNTTTVHAEGETVTLQLYPNPVSGQVFFIKNMLAGTCKEIKIFSNNGTMVKSWNAVQSEYNIADLPVGAYQVSILLKDESSQQFTLIKQ